MKSTLIIQEGRVLLEESVEHSKQLSLKICVGTSIYKFNHLTWNQPCRRWETTQQIKLAYLKGQPIELELFYPSKNMPQVIGEGNIDMAIFSSHLEEELKIALTYDGMIKGWLYCQIKFEGEGHNPVQRKYLCIHKIAFHFLEDYDNEFSLEIFQNTESIYEKKFLLSQTSKTLFPNIKNTILYSDVIRISLISSESEFKSISFLVDTIKRGKTAYYQTWLRNKFNNRAGDVKVQYFLQNLFLENDRKVMSRKAVFPNHLSRMSSLINEEIALKASKQSEKGLQGKNFHQISEEGSEDSTKLTERNFNVTRKSFKIHHKDPKSNSTCDEIQPQKKRKSKVIPHLKKQILAGSVKKMTKESFYFQIPFQ